eukprot:CAMPEP_0119338576 /NCGR_PEP_ID=MMETSP1333-20130426/96442_1 /TAXON_ID=418940 /ORGANISM="Scyphosphaera apsteinii, Strain RCC1455" /LENGTH=257 /DNA_ID=CAMNT_0007349895 /DNA_START=307 /DNA_END=1080 /DNA_ORIENTATION=-
MEIVSIVLNVVLLVFVVQLKALPQNGSGHNTVTKVQLAASPPLSGGKSSAATSLGEAFPAVNSHGEIILPHLSTSEDATLVLGKLVVQKGEVNGSKRGLAAQRINVSAATVWENLLAFDRWPKMIGDCTSTRVYYSDGKVFKVEVVVSVALLRIRTFVVHTYHAEKGVMTWNLDPNFDSDLASNSGFWHVREDTDDPNSCTVFYSVAVGLQKWAPRWLNSFIAVQGLPKAVSWVKRESEKKLARRTQSTGNLCSLGG